MALVVGTLDSERQLIDKAITGHERQIIILKHRRNSLSPVVSFPYDVLFAIFGYLKPQAEEASFKTLISITHVCSHWRKTALGTLRLWDTIPPIRNPAACEEILSRSKGTPLKIIFRAEHHENSRLEKGAPLPDTLKTLLSVVRSRARHIELRTSLHQTTEWFPDAISVLSKTKLPQLQTLILGCSEEVHSKSPPEGCNLELPRHLFRHSQSLLRLELYHCQIFWWNLFPLPNLKTLVIVRPKKCPSIPKLITMLSRLPNLSTLQLVGCLPTTSGTSSVENVTDFDLEPEDIAPSSVQNSLPLVPLRHLSLKNLARNMGAFLLVLGPAHPYLKIDISMYQIDNIKYTSQLGPLLRDYWQVKTLRSMSLVKSGLDNDRWPCILLHSTPDIIREAADFKVKLGLKDRWTELGADEICWEIVKGMQLATPTFDYLVSINTLHINMPINYDLWNKLSSSLPALSTLSYVYEEQGISSWTLADALSNSTLNAVGRESSALPPILFSQVKCFYFEATAKGTQSIKQTVFQMLVLYAKRRHLLGIACRKFGFRKFAPFPDVFVEELEQYLHHAGATTEKESELRKEVGTLNGVASNLQIHHD